MVRLTPIHWKRFEKVLLYLGCKFVREKGDHRVYWREGLERPIIIPREKELSKFIIRNNLRLLNINIDKYLEILKRI